MNRLIEHLVVVLAVWTPGCAKALPPATAPVEGKVTAESERAQDEFQASPLLSTEQVAEGWISLFDGRTLFGWKPNRESTNWRVEDGVITADAGDSGLLMTTVPWADFELRCNVRLEKGGNSGLFLRSTFDPKDPSRDCYELNVCDTHPEFRTGGLVARAKPEKIVETDGQWNTFTARLVGNFIQVQIDGLPVVHFTDDSEHVRRSGMIGLQMNGGKVEFRNIRLRPLEMKPIFNGRDLDGWRKVPGGKSNFEVRDGAIHVTSGRGYLETEAAWDDFVLRADVRVNGRHLNSGIFFRTLAGTDPADGYEMQIHNGTKEGDPAKPLDQGTGAIFRRAPARFVNARDGEWFTLLLVAHGPNFATWVNGTQQVAWTDTREPHENPRQGRRLEAGHISLQGHDPTTDLEFKNLEVAEYPNR